MTGPQPAPFRHDVSPSAAPALWKRAILRWNSRYRQLGRIVASNTLSPALAKFLHFIVMETLEGRADQLSEYVIAEKVFNQKEFAPSEKSVVRVEKRRLREKLKDYYEAAGKDDARRNQPGNEFCADLLDAGERRSAATCAAAPLDLGLAGVRHGHRGYDWPDSLDCQKKAFG
jgi:hypothetical protein